MSVQSLYLLTGSCVFLESDTPVVTRETFVDPYTDKGWKHRPSSERCLHSGSIRKRGFSRESSYVTIYSFFEL